MNAESGRGSTGKHLAAEKCVLFAGLGLLVTVPYFAIQYHPLFAAWTVPATAIDRSVPLFEPAAWVYLTLYALLVLPLFVTDESRELRKMAFGFAWITVVSHIVFVLWPTEIASFVSLSQASDPAMRLVLSVDTNRNAMPSLHASLAIYCALCSTRMIRSAKWRGAVWIWAGLILAATLLAKRHVILDLAAGAGLGIFAYAALFRAGVEETPESEALQETLRVRSKLAQGIEKQIAGLAKLDWRKRAVEIACFGGLGAFGVTMSVKGLGGGGWWLLAGGVAGTALALNAFVLLMHDGMHETLVRNRAGNHVASAAMGATFLMSFTAYRVLHTRHHKFLGDPRDPDDYKNYTDTGAVVWTLHFLRLTVGSLLYLLLIPVLALKFGDDAERRDILMEYAFFVAAYSALLRFVPAGVLAAVWFIPLLAVGTMTAIRGFTQHGITDATDPYIASRTILPNPVVGFFLLHENFHLEHHLFPEVPSYHLPELHRLIWPKLPRAVSGRSYLGFLVRFFQATPRMDETPIGLEHPATKSS